MHERNAPGRQLSGRGHVHAAVEGQFQTRPADVYRGSGQDPSKGKAHRNWFDRNIGLGNPHRVADADRDSDPDCDRNRDRRPNRYRDLDCDLGFNCDSDFDSNRKSDRNFHCDINSDRISDSNLDCDHN